MCIGMAANKDLIGNLIIYIADYCKNFSSPLYQTKLLKLLYLIDEESVRKNGTPITWLEYAVWQKGPVPTDIYFSKLPNLNKFEEYVSFVERSNKKFLIVKKKEFSDCKFSEIDLEIINNALSIYGKKTSDELIDITHKPGSLWSKIVEEKNIRFSNENHTSNETIDFFQLIADDKVKRFNYWASRDCIETNLAL